MHRAFRTPRVFQLPHVASRTRFASTVAQEKLRDQVATGSQHPAQQHKRNSSQANANNRQLSPRELRDQEMKSECSPYAKGARQEHVDGCRDLVDVREVMNIYRRHRDEAPASALGPVPASDAIHLILSTIRRRMVTLRSVISSVRAQIIAKQNEELVSYLKEIAADVHAKRSYVSAFALTYLFTAFSTMEQHGEATAVWKMLNNPFAPQQTAQSQSPQHSSETATELPLTPPQSPVQSEPAEHRVSDVVRDPRVVGAALVAADPAAMSLDDVEKIYEETVAQHGRHLLLDDALVKSYLRFHEYARAAQLYMDMCENYDVTSWEQSLSRLHNHILTQTKDLAVADAFFASATNPDSFVRLHPGAAAAYVRTKFAANPSDFAAIVDIFGSSVKALGHMEPKHYQNLTSEVCKTAMLAYPQDTPEARSAIEQLVAIASYSTDASVLLLNTILSCVSKQWFGSSFILELQARLVAVPGATSRVDSLRVLLNSCHSVAVPPSQVSQWWGLRKSLSVPLLSFDWLAFAKACDHVGRAELFVKEYLAAGPDGIPEFKRVMRTVSHMPELAQALAAASIELPSQQVSRQHTPVDHSAETVNASLHVSS